MGDDLGLAGPSVGPVTGSLGGGPDPVSRAEALADTEPRRALSILDTETRAGPAVGGRTEGRIEWVRGRALHQLGRHQEGTGHLESAVRILHRAGEEDLEAEAAVSLALARIDEARFDEAIDLLDRAAERLTGGAAAKALAQKALALQRSDRSGDALPAWDEAIDRFDVAGMGTEAAVARQNRGLVRMYRGDLPGAELDLTEAGRSFRAAGLDIRAVYAEHNLGLVHARRGDLPRAFELFDSAQAEAGRLGTSRPQTLVDRAQVALDAGLIPEGRTLAELAVEQLAGGGFQTDVPEACLLAARACELDGDPAAAGRWARSAADLLAAQERPRWELLALVAARRAEAAGGSDTAGELHELADRLRAAGWAPPAIEADTAAATQHVAHGRLEQAATILAELRAETTGASPAARLEIRLAQTAFRIASGDLAGARRAVTSAVRTLRAHRATVGSVELRSRATGRGDAVISAGVGVALASDAARTALWTAEAVRSPAPAGRHEDPEVSSLLAHLRDVNGRIGTLDAPRDLPPSADLTRLRRRRAAIEELLRRRSRHRRPPGRAPRATVDVDRIIDVFSRFPLIEYAAHADRLYALVVGGGDVSLVDLADLADARRVVAGLRMALHIAVLDGAGAGSFPRADLARAQFPREAADAPVPASVSGGSDALARASAAAQKILLGPLGLGSPEKATIVAHRALASFPWALLPDLAGTEVTATPSASWWLERSDRLAAEAPGGRVVLVAGPGLRHAEAEIEAIAGIWPAAEIIAGEEATVARVAEAIGRAGVIHVAAHASHRGDHPLLSGIRLWDGHLTGYELSTLHVPARLMVLSCCETGMAETAGGIGLSRLVTEQSGVATAVASVSPLADSWAGPLMTDFHRHLAAGATPARALVDSRMASGGAIDNPSAAGLVCFGI